MSAICEIVARCFPVYSRENVLEALEISGERLRSYTGTLTKIKPKGWDYQPYRRNFSCESFEVLKSFKTLVDLHGEIEAVNKIKFVCEIKFNGKSSSARSDQECNL